MSAFLALLRIAPLVLSTCVLRFSMDQLLFLWIFLNPRLAKHVNAVLPSYIDVFTTRKSYILSVFYPVLIATGLANRYYGMTVLSPSSPKESPSSAMWWYTTGTALALLHFSFTSRLNGKTRRIISIAAAGPKEDEERAAELQSWLYLHAFRSVFVDLPCMFCFAIAVMRCLIEAN
ncbi:hypothetical protein PG989_014006 [Apiospora arundinis]